MNSKPERRTCLRCGTCCRKGGPALHLQDRKLVEEGFIHTRDLYTIRKGEWAKDPVQGALVCVESDIIKIKGRGATWTCCFFEEGPNSCSIYAHRPMECLHLECWNPSRLELIYTRDRLCRRDLLSGMEGLWEMIADHERRCSYDRICGILKAMTDSGSAGGRAEIEQITRYDGELRKLLVGRGGLEPEMLDFLLGRPLTKTLPGLRRQISAAKRGRGRESASIRRHK